jgi:hypothetical protein
VRHTDQNRYALRIENGKESATDQEALGEMPIHELDKPRLLKDAAVGLGVGYHVVQRAARRGLVPRYYLGTSRPYVKLRDFMNLMERSSKLLTGE